MPEARSNGIISIPCQHDVDTTLGKLKAILEGKGVKIFAVVDHSGEAAKKNWEAFRNDPEWQKVQKESEANGKIVSKVDSVFMEPADFSALK